MAGNNSLTTVSYESQFGMVSLDADTVVNYLVRGKKNLVTEQEVVMFLKLCEAQKLNPFVTGEVYLIKYKADEPAQVVIGYDTYKRRAEEHPDFFNFSSGIVVQDRTGAIIHQKGTCLYPGQKLVGGWCQVNKAKFNQIVEAAYKEVSMEEYGKQTPAWSKMPCTMIAKVAISQALKQAYPKDYEGQYMPEEFGYDSDELANEKAGNKAIPTEKPIPEEVVYNTNEHELIEKEEIKYMFKVAKDKLGDAGLAVVKDYMNINGVPSSDKLTKAQYYEIMQAIDDKSIATESEKAEVTAEKPPFGEMLEQLEKAE